MTKSYTQKCSMCDNDYEIKKENFVTCDWCHLKACYECRGMENTTPVKVIETARKVKGLIWFCEHCVDLKEKIGKEYHIVLNETLEKKDDMISRLGIKEQELLVTSQRNKAITKYINKNKTN